MLFSLVLVLGLVWELKAARGAAEVLLGLVPAGFFGLSWFMGGVAQVLAGTLAGMGVTLIGELLSLLMLVAVGNKLRGRRMQEVIDAA